MATMFAGGGGGGGGGGAGSGGRFFESHDQLFVSQPPALHHHHQQHRQSPSYQQHAEDEGDQQNPPVRRRFASLARSARNRDGVGLSSGSQLGYGYGSAATLTNTADMPSSFLPSLPTGLPTYPSSITHLPPSKQLGFSGGRSSSSRSIHSSGAGKRSRGSTRSYGSGSLSSGSSSGGYGEYGSPPPLSRFYDTPQDPRFVLEDSDNEMDLGISRGATGNSLYGERSWRASMGGSGIGSQGLGSRKRGRDDYSEDEYEDEDEDAGRGGSQDRMESGDGRAKKRRIMDMVGTVFGKVWELCKATSYYPVTVLTGVGAGTCSQATSATEERPPLQLLARRDSSRSSPSPPPPATQPSLIRSSTAPNPPLLRERSYSSANTLSNLHHTTAAPSPKPLQKDWVFVSPQTHTPLHHHRRATSAHIPRRTPVRPSPRYKKPKPRSRPSTANTIIGSGVGSGAGMRRFGGYAGQGGSLEDELSEDEEDESIRRFNEKLKEMIREGKEALGSKVEVYYED